MRLCYLRISGDQASTLLTIDSDSFYVFLWMSHRYSSRTCSASFLTEGLRAILYSDIVEEVDSILESNWVSNTLPGKVTRTRLSPGSRRQCRLSVDYGGGEFRIDSCWVCVGVRYNSRWQSRLPDFTPGRAQSMIESSPISISHSWRIIIDSKFKNSIFPHWFAYRRKKATNMNIRVFVWK